MVEIHGGIAAAIPSVFLLFLCGCLSSTPIGWVALCSDRGTVSVFWLRIDHLVSVKRENNKLHEEVRLLKQSRCANCSQLTAKC